MNKICTRFLHLENVLHHQFVAHSVAVLRVAVGLVFLGFGVLKYFPGAGRPMRIAMWLLATEFVGILSPLVLLPARLFSGPDGAPTLEGQYVLKDIILVGAAMVIAAATFRGGRLVRSDLPPARSVRPGQTLDGEQKLRTVLEGGNNPSVIAALCEQRGLSEAEFYAWRETARVGAAQALEPVAAPILAS